MFHHRRVEMVLDQPIGYNPSTSEDYLDMTLGVIKQVVSYSPKVGPFIL